MIQIQVSAEEMRMIFSALWMKRRTLREQGLAYAADAFDALDFKLQEQIDPENSTPYCPVDFPLCPEDLPDDDGSNVAESLPFDAEDLPF